jgi:hypothetical protein
MTNSCPRCKKYVESLSTVPADLHLRLLDVSLSEAEYPSVCDDCLSELKRVASNPDVLKIKAYGEANRKQALWLSRNDALKKAREALSQNQLLNASTSFLNYIEILRSVFEHGPGPLTPDVFRAMNKIEEMKTLILVYWELVQIQDGKNERLMDQYSRQLALFGKCSPIKMALLQELQAYAPKAQFKKYIRRTERELRGEKGIFSIFKAS